VQGGDDNREAFALAELVALNQRRDCEVQDAEDHREGSGKTRRSDSQHKAETGRARDRITPTEFSLLKACSIEGRAIQRNRAATVGVEHQLRPGTQRVADADSTVRVEIDDPSGRPEYTVRGVGMPYRSRSRRIVAGQ